MKQIRRLINLDESKESQSCKSSNNRGIFSRLVNQFFKDEKILIVLDGADTWSDSWFPSESFTKTKPFKPTVESVRDGNNVKKLSKEKASRDTKRKQ